jgi:hypothetical protein
MSIDEPAPKKSNTLWYILGAVGLVGIFGCCCVPGGVGGYWWYSNKVTNEEREKKVETEAGLAVTANDLSIAYQENIGAADAKFKDKVLIVTGNVMNAPTADAVTLKPGVPPNKIAIGGVHCTFSDKNKSQLTAMKLNDQVKIKGYCTGMGFLSTGTLVQCKKVD